VPYSERLFSCAGCGVPVFRRAAAAADVRCILCSIERSVENMRQLRAGKGAFYDKWAAGIAAAGRRAVVQSEANKESERQG
jgi:hypothetical protein